MNPNSSPLVNTTWLADHLHDPNLRIIDVRWNFREKNGQGVAFDDREGFLNEHIPGAMYVGMATELADRSHQVPDMMLGPDQFAIAMQKLGISNDSHVVVYDDSGLPLASARLWWALSYFGHDNVQVLDGGLQQWKLEGHHTESGEVQKNEGSFVSDARPSWIAQKSEVHNAVDDKHTQIVDCLPNNLYQGKGTHTWGGRSGHIPGAINIPAISNIDPALASTPIAERAEKLKARGSFRLADQKELLQHYKEKGLEPENEVIVYCGRGIAASCGLLTLRHLGFHQSRLYDGSWAEWSADERAPVESS